MNKEQEEAIKLATKFTKMNFSNPMGWTGYYDTELNELSIAIETVLNMLKEKDSEIQKKDRIMNEIQKELSNHIGFENRLKRENKEPDLFNQGRFYVANNINIILKGK